MQSLTLFKVQLDLECGIAFTQQFYKLPRPSIETKEIMICLLFKDLFAAANTNGPD